MTLAEIATTPPPGVSGPADADAPRAATTSGLAEAAAALSANLASASSRLQPRRPSALSYAIYLGLIGLWCGLLTVGLVLKGPFAWTTGVLYVCYDTVLLGITLVLTLRLWRARTGTETQAATRGSDSLAVIVAAHNEAAILASVLRALAAQEEPAERIIIADDGSSDETEAVLAREFGLVAPDPGEMSAPSPVMAGLYWLRLPHGGKARALNAAIIRASETLVLTVDADTALKPGALKAMRAAFAADPDLCAGGGVLTPLCGEGAVGAVFQRLQTYEYVRNFVSRFAYMGMESLLLVSGAFAAFRRESLIAIGGFDPECLVEDYELIHRLHRYSVDHGRGWKVRIIGDAQATTDAPATIPTFLRQRRRWFAGFLQTQYWHRDMIGDRRFGALGRLMLPIKAFDALQPVFGLTAFFLLLFFLVFGQLRLVLFVLLVMATKIVVDLAFHLYAVASYRRWTGIRVPILPALVASCLEPFSFQLLRHWGAGLGWAAFLRGRHQWGAQARASVAREGMVS